MASIKNTAKNTPQHKLLAMGKPTLQKGKPVAKKTKA
jgi:hypothetical protein